MISEELINKVIDDNRDVLERLEQYDRGEIDIDTSRYEELLGE